MTSDLRSTDNSESHVVEANTPEKMAHSEQEFRLLDFDAYLFDIDGTLLNSHDAVHYNAFHSALQNVYGCELKIDNVPVHGNTDIGILRAALNAYGATEAEFSAGLLDALEHMFRYVDRNAGELRPVLCPGTRALLETLASSGKVIGIVSGNVERIGWLKLEAAGIREFFSIGSFSDRNELREDIYRWGLEEARRRLGSDVRVCFVGDTPADVLAARALNMPVIAVATGIYPVAELQKLRPSACISCYGDLIE
ncbi:MAG TPA: HAD family hydrolase [Clostridia bacterium]|nr:HAD family hydrolase [Clostridia bacterium]